jgi:hypothetical protein
MAIRDPLVDQEHISSREEMYEIGNAQPAGSGFGTGGIIIDDYNPNLVGVRGTLVYDKMRRSDGIVRSALRVIKTPLLAAEWYVEPATYDDYGKEVAEFVDQALNGMSRSFLGVLQEALLMLDYGYYAFEKVFKEAKFRPSRGLARERDVVVWKKWGPRHPKNTTGWVFDRNGGVQVLKQNRDPNGFDEVPIPVDKLLLFTLDEEGGNPEGISLLRSCYPHWYYRQNLYKIDAIQKERHGIGVPYAELPPNATSNDMKFAQELTQNLRTNEKAGVVKPYGWDIGFLQPNVQQVNVLESAQHHGVMMLTNMLAQFLALGTTQSGSRAVGSTQEDIFVKSTHYLADLMRSVINKWAIPELVRYNYDTADYPRLRVRRLGDTSDVRALSVALRNLAEAKIITPDAEIEKFVRNVQDLPGAPDDALEGADRTLGANYSNRVPGATDAGTSQGGT